MAAPKGVSAPQSVQRKRPPPEGDGRNISQTLQELSLRQFSSELVEEVANDLTHSLISCDRVVEVVSRGG